jgi:hypothetical protein
MAHSIFGWSYPPGCSGPPDDEEIEQPRCSHCKAFLPWEPDMTAPKTFTYVEYVDKPIKGANCYQEIYEDPTAGPLWPMWVCEFPDNDICLAWRCRNCGKLTEFYDY